MKSSEKFHHVVCIKTFLSKLFLNRYQEHLFLNGLTLGHGKVITYIVHKNVITLLISYIRIYMTKFVISHKQVSDKIPLKCFMISTLMNITLPFSHIVFILILNCTIVMMIWWYLHHTIICTINAVLANHWELTVLQMNKFIYYRLQSVNNPTNITFFVV